MSGGLGAHFAVSNNGTLVYKAGTGGAPYLHWFGELVWVDREGAERPLCRWRPGQYAHLDAGRRIRTYYVRHEPILSTGRHGVSCSVSTGSEFKPGIPVPLFEGRYLKATLRQLNVVLNWFEELKRLVPPN